MTSPSPFDEDEDYMTLRRRWYGRYLSIQAPYDAEIRELLRQGADEAEKRIKSLEKSKEWEDQVRVAQIRLSKREIQIVLRDIFKESIPIISRGHKSAANVAVDALTATDKRYLQIALGDSGVMKEYVASQKVGAMAEVANAINRITSSKKPLSERVYRTKALATKWIDHLLTTSIMRGDSAEDIAKAVRGNIRPDAPGGVSYAAMRLGRTELNNAFHATAITLSQDRPWVTGMAWNLSATHKNDSRRIPEVCEIYAAKVWPVDEVPEKPHPQCRCFVTPKLEAYETFMRHLAAGQYREWMENAA